MPCPKPFFEADSGHHGCHQHLRASLDVSRLLHDQGQVEADAIQCAQGYGFNYRVNSGGQVFFNCMAEGVHAAACRQERRKAQREVWVEDGVNRDKEGACSDHFSGEAVPGRDDEGSSRDFASGSCRSGDGDHG